MDSTPPGSSVHGILQAGILEWVASSFSRGSNPGLPHCRQILYHLSHQGSRLTISYTMLEFSTAENVEAPKLCIVQGSPVLCFSLNQLGNSSILQKHVCLFVCFPVFMCFFPTSLQILLPCPVVLHYMGSLHGGGMMRRMNKDLSNQMANLKRKITKLEHQVKKSQTMTLNGFKDKLTIKAKIYS